MLLSKNDQTFLITMLKIIQNNFAQKKSRKILFIGN